MQDSCQKVIPFQIHQFRFGNNTLTLQQQISSFIVHTLNQTVICRRCEGTRGLYRMLGKEKAYTV
jgi:hypothetical protein